MTVGRYFHSDCAQATSINRFFNFGSHQEVPAVRQGQHGTQN